MSHPQSDLPSPFYRVSVKALIFDDQNRLLVGRGRVTDDRWEMPGGGLEHQESIENCLKRELQEEFGIETESIGKIAFTYRGQNPRGYWALRLAIPVKLKSHSFKFGDMSEAKFVTQEELEKLDMQPDEGAIRQCADQIWPD